MGFRRHICSHRRLNLFVAGSVNEVVHTEAGNDYTSWVVDWTAPESGKSVDFIRACELSQR